MWAVSLVDALKDHGGGPAAGEFRAPFRSRLLASLALAVILVMSLLGFVSGLGTARTSPFADTAAMGLVLPVFFATVAIVCWGVRMGRLRIDADGVRWGFRGFGFRMHADRIEVARLYRDAVAVVPRSGLAWYLAGRDWDPWARVGPAFRRTPILLEQHDRSAPLVARLQGYGLTLDLILIVDALAAILLP